MKQIAIIAGILLIAGLLVSTLIKPSSATANGTPEITTSQSAGTTVKADADLSVATLAGGCFWCVEAAFEKVPGVAEVISGYTGGEENSPRYKQVASGKTGHTEAVQIHYDASVITYEGLLAALWRTANPTDNQGQYVDRGRQYRPEIFYHNEAQKLAAIESKQKLNDSGRYDKPVVIAITQATEFYPAEDYHQDYYKTNPRRYKFYTQNSGRYQFIDSVWPEGREIDYSLYRPEDTADKNTSDNKGNTETGSLTETTAMTETLNATGFNAATFVKPSNDELKQSLSAIEFKVTQKDGTERAFSNPMHKEKRSGLYVDIVSGEPLFSSVDKFDSGTGWPSFDRPITDGVVVEKSDISIFGKRIEIRSAVADSHLGHVFNDGPATTGKRYCMNAAAMRFIPTEEMAESGYGDYIARVSAKQPN